MDGLTALDLVNKIEYHYNRKVKSSEGIQESLLEHLTSDQFKKFCKAINGKKRNEMLPSALIKNFNEKVLDNPVDVSLCIKDSEVAENWTFGQIIQAVQIAVQ